MTKERLRRYFELDRDYEDSGRLDPGGPPDGPRLLEYEALAREFDAWSPEQAERERDEAREAARDLLQDLCARATDPLDLRQWWIKQAPWLKEPHGSPDK